MDQPVFKARKTS